MASEDDRLTAEANRLYWESELSVNNIADELGLSKGTLYGLVRPLPTGEPCPECGSELVFENRTARDRGLGTCPACGAEADAEEAVVALTGGGRDDAEEGSTDSRFLTGAVLLGVAAGFIIARLTRGR